jgi:uncharacterized membrane protein YeiH
MQNYNLYYSFMGVKFATHMKQRIQTAFKNGVLRRMFGGIIWKLHNMELPNLYYSSGSISITNEEGCSGQGTQLSQYT